ncbi:MAG: M20 family peptidase, partial [Dehalococcoidia bacterium]
MANLLSYLKAQTQDMVSLLQKLVEMESPTSEKEAVDALGSFLRERLVELGAQVEVVEQAERGNHLLARWEGEGRQVLILCHMDTVWPIGTLKLRPFRRDGGIARGPGIFDM